MLASSATCLSGGGTIKGVGKDILSPAKGLRRTFTSCAMGFLFSCAGVHAADASLIMGHYEGSWHALRFVLGVTCSINRKSLYMEDLFSKGVWSVSHFMNDTGDMLDHEEFDAKFDVHCSPKM